MGDSITRREFTLKSALAMLAGATITVAGCESDSPTAPTNGEPTIFATVSANHGHQADLSTADLTRTMVTLDIQGDSSPPPHRRTQHGRPTSYRQRHAVSVSSTNDAGHSHDVSFQVIA
jgi:hypothetical protein